MKKKITIEDCPVHDACTVITHAENGWESHDDAAIDPFSRLNPDDADAVDLRQS